MQPVRHRIERELAEPEARLDRALIGRLRGPTVENYRRFLCDVYGFLEPLERTLAFSGGLELAFVGDRVKSGKVAADLLACGLTQAEYPLLARVFPMGRFASRCDALAWLYVAERLVHVYAPLREMLAPSLPREMKLATRYLQSHDHEQWCHLLGRLEAYAFSPLARTHMLVAIRDATERVTAWASVEPLSPLVDLTFPASYAPPYVSEHSSQSPSTNPHEM